MSRADELVSAILRRYRDWRNAGMPPEQDFPLARNFARLAQFAASPNNDALLRDASLAVIDLAKIGTGRGASIRTVSRVLAAVTEGGAP